MPTQKGPRTRKNQRVNHSHLVSILEHRLKTCSTRELARQLGVSQPYISEITTGRKNIGPDLARKLGFKPVTGIFEKL